MRDFFVMISSKPQKLHQIKRIYNSNAFFIVRFLEVHMIEKLFFVIIYKIKNVSRA